MKLRALFGWGIVIYAIFFLVWSILQTYGYSQGVFPGLIELLTLFTICVIAGSSLKFRRWKDILPYSISWAIIAAFLDGILAEPTQNLSIFSQWSTWVAYGLVVLFPLCAIFFKKHRTHGGVWET